MTLVCGTDNVFLPSVELQTVSGKPFKECQAPMYFFSKKVGEIFLKNHTKGQSVGLKGGPGLSISITNAGTTRYYDC